MYTPGNSMFASATSAYVAATMIGSALRAISEARRSPKCAASDGPSEVWGESSTTLEFIQTLSGTVTDAPPRLASLSCTLTQIGEALGLAAASRHLIENQAATDEHEGRQHQAGCQNRGREAPH